jgi:hypothetical protein
MHALQAVSRSHAVAKAIELGLISVGPGQTDAPGVTLLTRSAA